MQLMPYILYFQVVEEEGGIFTELKAHILHFETGSS